jgi:hypothetical protein
MRILKAVLVVALAAGECTIAGAAEPGFSDTICPEATQYVLAVGKVRKDDPPQRVYDAAQAATNAYERCSRDKLSNGFREAQHYADTRASAFAVVAARALVALNRSADARRELEHWRPLAAQVVDWESETQTSVQGHRPVGDIQSAGGTVTGSDHRKSMYHDSAKEIVAAIDAEIAKIDTAAHEQPRPQGRSAETPAPSPKP